MKKLYLSCMVILLLGVSPPLSAKHLEKNSTVVSINDPGDKEIEGFRMYPNPVSNGTITIETKRNLAKDIVIFNVLGKEVLKTRINAKTLSVSSLNTGVYILKVTEDDSTSVRKLVVR